MKLPDIPWWVYAGVLALGGLGFLAWHRYALDDHDTQWNTTPDMFPPPMADLPIVPAQHGTGSPMSCNAGFRSRSYPGSLVQADFSVAGGC